MTADNQNRPRLALVLGSGSVKCSAALGMMKVLERENIALDMLVGCSAGSLYAAAIALGWPAEKTIEMTTRLWTREVTGRRSRRAILQLLLPGLFGFDERFGLTDDSLLNHVLDEAFGQYDFADAGTPCFLTATDLYTGEQVTISEGKFSQAIRGSLSIPYIFPPAQLGKRYLLDGYLSDPLPVGVAIREGADIIIAMGFESGYQSRISSLLRYNFQISSITNNNLLRTNYAFHNLAHHSEIIPVLPEFEQHISLFATDKIPYVISAGEKAFEQQLPVLKQMLAQS